MRKQILLGIAALLVGVLPTLAQDEEVEVLSCTPEDTAVFGEIVFPLLTSHQEIGMSVDAADPTTGTEAVIGFNALATDFWITSYPELPNCLEAGALGYNFGIAFDESLINIGLARLSLYESEYGDAELAQSLADLMMTRTDWYKSVVENTFGQISEENGIPDSMFSYELEACTAEDGESEAVTAFNDSIEAYNELSQSLGDITDEEASVLLFAFAELGTTYWIEIYPELPACAEISQDGYNIGLVYNEQVIVMMLQRLAAYEEEYGTPEAAQALTEGAEARAELAQSFIEAAFPDPDAEAE